MAKSVTAVGYDIKKMPLGELSKETVQKGYEVLKKIESVLQKKSTGNLTQLSGEFYTMIPHNFGMQKMSNFVIDTLDKMRDKFYLVQNLIAIQDAHQMMKKDEKPKSKVQTTLPNPIDKNFAQLNIDMQTLPKTSDEY